MAALDHPNIIPVFEGGEVEGQLYIAMRFVQSTDLRALIEQQGPLGPARALSIIAQAASALDAAHERSLVHRDVKPANILIAVGAGIEGADHVYLCDFGLTKDVRMVSGLTRTGHFVGTVDYVAPEQIAGQDIDGRTDQYALASVFYECLSGRVPFPRTEQAAVLFAHVQDPPPKVSDLRPELPSAIDDVILRAMAKRKEDRYATCGDFVRAAREALATFDSPPSEPPPRLEAPGLSLSVPELRAIPPESYTPKDLAERIRASRSTLEGERKPVTVLHCDVANSVELGEEVGPEQLHALLSAFLQLAFGAVHRYEGTVNQFLDDGFVALFGAPIAHEDHGRRAVLSALDLRRWVADLPASDVGPGWEKLRLRMGLHSGFVVVGRIGSDLRMGFTAEGATIHVAARLQSEAEPGDILVSEATKRLVDGYVDLEALPPVEVTWGLGEIRPYRLLGPVRRRSGEKGVSGRGLTPFVGRTPELGVLRQVVDRVGPGHGEVVSISGEPGIGKSRLFAEFLEQLESEEISVAIGRCVSYGAGIPYLPVIEIVRELSGSLEGDPPKVVADRMRGALVSAGRDAEADLPFLLNLLGLPGGADALADVDPATMKGRTLEILRQLVLRLSMHRPIAIVVENIQWIDASSSEFLAGMAESLVGAPILLAATLRPGYVPPWTGRSHVTQLSLEGLNEEDSSAIVRWWLAGSAVSDAAIAAILERADGNPFFLEELAHSFAEIGSEGDTGVPDTVKGVLAARIDRLSEVDKRVLHAASVLGREFTMGLLQAVLDDGTDVETSLLALRRAEFLYERFGPLESTYAFRSVLTQDAVYESLLPGRKRAWHGRAAARLEELYGSGVDDQSELIAHHYARSNETAKAIDYLELANEKAIQSHALVEARAYFVEALGRLEDQQGTRDNQVRRVRLLLKQFPVFHYAHGHQEYYDLLIRYKPVVEEIGDPALQGAFLTQLGHRLWVFAEYERAHPILEEAVALCDAAGDVPNAAHADIMRQWCMIWGGDIEHAEEIAHRVIDRLAGAHVPHVDMVVRVGLAVMYTVAGRFDDAVASAEKGIARGEELEDDGVVAFNAAFKAYALLHKQDWDGALDAASFALQRAPTVFFRGWAQLFLSAAQCGSGQLEPGLELMAQTAELIGKVRHDTGVLFISPLLARAYLEAGDLERAAKVTADLRERADEAGAAFMSGTARRLSAELSMRTGRVGVQTAQGLRESIATLREIAAENELAFALATEGRRLWHVADDRAARARLEEALGIFDRLGTHHEPERIRKELSALG